MTAPAVAPDGKLAASADADGTIHVWQLQTRLAEPPPSGSLNLPGK